MRRDETIETERWRIQARKGGRVVREAMAKTEFEARLAFVLLRQANEPAIAAGEGYDNIELQVRRAGRSRYEPVLQAVGHRIIEW